MKPLRALLVLLVVLAVGLGLGRAVLADDGTGWSPSVYPEQRLPLVFSHARHLGRGTACAACHPAATTSRSAVDNLIPTEAACRACHPIDRALPERVVAGAPPARCLACHPGWTPDQPVARVYLTPTPLKFAHAESTQRHPAQRMQVTQATGAVLDVGFQVFRGVAETRMAQAQLLALGYEKIAWRPYLRGRDGFGQHRLCIRIRAHRPPFDQRGKHGLV